MRKRSKPGRGKTPVLVVSLAVAAVAIIFLTSTLAGQASTAVSDTEKFKLLYDSLRDLSKDYANDVLKTIASLLLVIGWLMISEGSRKFLAQNVKAWRTALVVIPVVAVINTVWLIDKFLVSESKMKLLDRLNYLPRGYYAGERITPVLIVADIVLHLALFAAVFGLAYSQRGARSDAGKGSPSA